MKISVESLRLPPQNFPIVPESLAPHLEMVPIVFMVKTFAVYIKLYTLQSTHFLHVRNLIFGRLDIFWDIALKVIDDKYSKLFVTTRAFHTRFTHVEMFKCCNVLVQKCPWCRNIPMLKCSHAEMSSRQKVPMMKCPR